MVVLSKGGTIDGGGLFPTTTECAVLAIEL